MSILFTEKLAMQIAAGNKTQTRRPKKSGEKLCLIDGVKTVLTVSGRLKHAVGKVRAIPYGRGLPSRWWNPETRQLMEYDYYREGIHLYGKSELPVRLRNEGYEPFKIEILDIREEADVRDITHADAVAEGFRGQVPKFLFLQTWMQLYDPTFMYRWQGTEFTGKYNDFDLSHCPEWLFTRPAHKYQGEGGILVYEFKVHGF